MFFVELGSFLWGCLIYHNQQIRFSEPTSTVCLKIVLKSTNVHSASYAFETGLFGNLSLRNSSPYCSKANPYLKEGPLYLASSKLKHFL